MLDSSIFKSYDVRGIYPEQLNENTAYQIGKAFVKYISGQPSHEASAGKAKKVVVGYDVRLSSPELFLALSNGLLAEGAEVYSIGQVPTEMLYFAVANYNFDAGIMITASHNPKEYNGFKMMQRNGKDIAWIRGKDLFSSMGAVEPVAEKAGMVHEKNIWQDYINYILKFSGDMGALKVVVDASNGFVGNVMEKMKPSLPVEMIALNFKPDGNFPNHSPNPLDEGASDQIEKEIKKHKADVGFMFDADADRIFLIDEQGNMVSADIALLLLAKYFLQKSPGSVIAYNLICSRSVPEFIKKWGGVPVRTQVGFVNVREGLIQNNGIMGGELSAHYCFRDYFYMDSGMIAFLTLLQIISRENKKVSDIVKALTIYAKPAQANFAIEDKNAVLEKVKEKYKDGKQDYLDGVTVEYETWWFNLRPSNTEPLLKLTLEAQTQELLNEKKKELTEFILK